METYQILELVVLTILESIYVSLQQGTGDM